MLIRDKYEIEACFYLLQRTLLPFLDSFSGQG